MVTKRKVLTWALIMLVIVSGVAVSVPYIGRALFPMLTGDPPLFVPNTPIMLMDTEQLNPNATKGLILHFTLVFMPGNNTQTFIIIYDMGSHRLTWESGPSNYWVIVNIDNWSMDTSVRPIWNMGKRPIWFWSPGDQITLTITQPIKLEFYCKAKQ